MEFLNEYFWWFYSLLAIVTGVIGAKMVYYDSENDGEIFPAFVAFSIFMPIVLVVVVCALCYLLLVRLVTGKWRF